MADKPYLLNAISSVGIGQVHLMALKGELGATEPSKEVCDHLIDSTEKDLDKIRSLVGYHFTMNGEGK